MPVNLNELIGFTPVIGPLVERIKTGLPTDWLPPAFTRVTKRIAGATGEYKRVDGTRETALRVARGAPAVRLAQKGITKVAITAISTFHDIMHEEDTLEMLFSDSPEVRREGKDEVVRQTGTFYQQIRNLRLSAVASALSQGTINFDINGNLLPNTTSAAVSIDFGIPASNRTQLDILGDGSIIDASWATATTDIVSQLTAIRQQIAKKCGYIVTDVFYGANVPGYIAKNNNFANIIKGNANVANEIKQGIIPAGTGGFNWHPATDAFYEDSDGDLNTWFGDDTVVFTPRVESSWYQYIEGSRLIPTSLGQVSADATAAARNLKKIFGFFSYATMTQNPIGIQHFAGDTFLPIISAPYAVAIGDVTP